MFSALCNARISLLRKIKSLVCTVGGLQTKASQEWKKLLIAAVFALVTMLYVGYYEALEDGDIETIVFIKKHPTLQMKFYNIHANDERLGM